MFNNLWSLAHTCSLRHLLTDCGQFYPEYVGAAIPNNMSRCAVTSYGVRRRLPFRVINMYSDMLAVTCRPL